MKTYYIQTDSFQVEIKAPRLNAAIQKAFGSKANNLKALTRYFAPFVSDGAWCFIDEDGSRVVEIGSR